MRLLAPVLHHLADAANMLGDSLLRKPAPLQRFQSMRVVTPEPQR